MLYTKLSRIILVASIFVLAFWLFGNAINVYSYAVVGAIFELLWLPVIAATIAFPVFSFLLWRKEKFRVRSLHLYSFFISIATVVMLIAKSI